MMIIIKMTLVKYRPISFLRQPEAPSGIPQGCKRAVAVRDRDFWFWVRDETETKTDTFEFFLETETLYSFFAVICRNRIWIQMFSHPRII